MKILFIAALLVAIDAANADPALAPLNGSVYAVDLSVEANADAMRCLKKTGYSIVFVRGYDPSGEGQFDKNAAQTLHLANTANLDTEVYMEPNPRSSKSATQQFTELYEGLKKSGIRLLKIWLQVRKSGNWSSDGSANTAFVTELVDAVLNRGPGVGFYTTREDWTEIIDAPGFAGGALLWYSSVRGEGESGETPANFKHFVSFYPFPGASVKQFAQGENVCGLKVNRDIYYVGRASKPAGEQLGAEGLVVGKATPGAHN
ncbi:unnamed protein product [Nippostrongylus brasiliensis]|uniref:Lysozyme n=1 Tax=Nippostrongylus brasiliensis TaxID=27835 RepID=A0A0N4YN10_NIPBR|nr:unnamed protein product [Nippostrongylus brasiliensis]